MATCEEQMSESLGFPVLDYHPSRHVVGIRGAIQLSFTLLEPVIYLQGDDRSGLHFDNKPAVTRGCLHLKVTQKTKIKSICVSFHGIARLHLLGESTRRQDLITSGITFFEAGHTTSLDRGCYRFCDKSMDSSQHVKGPLAATPDEQISPPEYDPGSLCKSGLLNPGSEVTRNTISSYLRSSYGVFSAGDYTYPFEFLVHDTLPETISTELISIRYYLEAKVESPGKFRSKMRSQLDISLLRLPSVHSFELTEPIVISKNWREQLHYNACILGRSFHLGSRIPVSLQLTPLVNLKCRWIKVYVSQHMQYLKMGTEARLLPIGRRRVLLFEKKAGTECKSTFPGSGFQNTSDQDIILPVDMQTPSLLGKVLETCQIELDVQLPRCPELKETPQWQRLQTSTQAGKPNVNHWIQIVMCLSKEDKNETATRKHDAFQLLVIETPITVLSCKATPPNIYVPPYTIEPSNKPLPSRNLDCDCVGTHFPKDFAPMHRPEVPKTAASTSLEPLLPDNITRPLNFDIPFSDIKPPAQVHIARRGLPDSPE